jgi:HEPN domain-containing protein
MICFHAQQCVEKYLKALLASRDIKNPRSHDLTELVGLLPASFRPRISMNRLARLNPYAVESRYPSPGKPETRQEALQALKTASKVRQEALRMLGVRKRQDPE